MGGQGSGGANKKPALQIVREGNPGKRPVPSTLTLPPAELEEPDWFRWFPMSPDDAFALGGADPSPGLQRRVETDELCREEAHLEWTTVYGMLDQQGLIADADRSALRDYCLSVARVLQFERDISQRGPSWETEKGEVANPSVRHANVYRTAMRNYARKMGLTPADRNGLGQGNGAGRGKEGSPFDI